MLNHSSVPVRSSALINRTLVLASRYVQGGSRRSSQMCHLLTCQFCHSTPMLPIIQIRDVTEAVISPATLPKSHDEGSVWECIALRNGQEPAFEGADQICRDDHEDAVVSELANLSEYLRSKLKKRSSSPSQKRVELTSGNINSWWLDSRSPQLQRDVVEEITPNHPDATDRINRQLQLRVGDVVWYARRPATPEVSVFCRESIGSVLLRHLLVSPNFPRYATHLFSHASIA